MKRRRWRRIAMWAGLAACGVTGLTLLFSLFGVVTVTIISNGEIERGHFMAIGSGAFGHLCMVTGPPLDPRSREAGTLELDSVGWHIATEPWDEQLRQILAVGLLAKFSSDSSEWMYSIPLWIPFVLLAVPTFLLGRIERRDRRRAAAGACGGCGYDLTGNVTGRCPECGAAAEAPAGSKLPS